MRTFFGKGWDNAALDTVFRAMIKTPKVQEEIKKEVAKKMDPRTLENWSYAVSLNPDVSTRLFLPPHIGDPHRLLKAYAITAYPIVDEAGKQVMYDGSDSEVIQWYLGALPCFADPDDDYSKIAMTDLELTEYLGKELLTLLEWEASPRGAASFLESLYRGSSIPDYVFETPRVITRF
jgi:hypothetical protein